MQPPRSPQNALKTFLAFGVTGAAIGAGVGALLGKVAPSYYRFVFEAESDPSFDPVGVGFGLGLTQGLIGGALCAAVVAFGPSLVAAIAHKPEPVSSKRKKAWLPWTLAALLGLFVLVSRIPGLLGEGEPRLAWRDGKLALWNFSLHDVVATHLIAEDRYAALPNPLLLKSHWNEATVDARYLKWLAPTGEIAAAPVVGSEVGIVFVDARTTMR
ncbi:hypothetical protein EON82_03500 [bacterium]|nr:MAG: hypothetical protein EON82_03500 [bacterium]